MQMALLPYLFFFIANFLEVTQLLLTGTNAILKQFFEADIANDEKIIFPVKIAKNIYSFVLKTCA